ncbi:FIG139438: lipoprotein B [hydrothermal vent metagenome]|uniref:FIG139438: lipoprotein B n=1 Tax=hydrothermal vent metagenome TaxID=652676 RepID=A0A3B0RWZ0_9ZZZZ
MKDKLLQMARGKNAMRSLFGVAFIESWIFPIPPDVMLIPMVLARPQAAWRIAGICTLASVLGGILGYGIGWFAFTSIGQPVLEIYGKVEAYEAFKNWFDQWGFWAAFGAGFTPFPYKVITITSGAVHLNFIIFMLASVLSRGGRFFLVAAIIRFAGDRARAQIEKHFGLITLALFVMLALVFIGIKYVH